MGSEKRERTSREKIAEIREILADVCVYEEDEIKEEIDHIELCQIYEDLTELNKRLRKIIELVKEEPTAAADGSEISDDEAIEYLKILEKRMFDISGSAWLGDIPIGVIEVGINAIKALEQEPILDKLKEKIRNYQSIHDSYCEHIENGDFWENHTSDHYKSSGGKATACDVILEFINELQAEREVKE